MTTEIDMDVALDHFAKKAQTWLTDEDAGTGDPPIPAHRALTQLVAYGLGSDVALQFHALGDAVTWPLQRLIGYGLLGMGYSFGDQVVLKTGGRELSFLEFRPQILTVETDAKRDGVHADFALSLKLVTGYDDHGDPIGPVSELFVLCDAEDTYEVDRAQLRGEEQAEKRLRSLGKPVLRFSKSEIWADPMGCAAKAYDVMLNDVRRQRQAEVH